MTSTEVLAPPSNSNASEASHGIHGLDNVFGSDAGGLAGLFQPTQLGRDSASKRGSWKADAVKANLGISSLLDLKAEPQEVVALDAFVQPVDRGPAAAADAQRYLRTWQYQVSGKVAAAAVLADVKAEHIKHGGPMSIEAEARRLIELHNLDDTFYMVDLGNVLRMFKAR